MCAPAASRQRPDSERPNPFACFQELGSDPSAIAAPYIHNGFLAQCLTCSAPSVPTATNERALKRALPPLSHEYYSPPPRSASPTRGGLGDDAAQLEGQRERTTEQGSDKRRRASNGNRSAVIRVESLTWTDVWHKFKSYRADWFDGFCAIAIVVLCVANSWWADWSLRRMAVGPVCALLGWIAVSILPLWFHRR